MRPWVVLPVFFSLLVACGGPIDPDNAWTEVGVGQTGFESIEDGQVMEVELGAQGGMHIWVSMRAWGIDPGPSSMWQGLSEGSLPLIGFTITGPAGVHTPENVRPYVPDRAEGEYELLENLVTFDHFPELPDNWQDLDFDEVEAELENTDLQLGVELTDVLGTVVQDSVTIRLDFPAPSEEEEEELGR